MSGCIIQQNDSIDPSPNDAGYIALKQEEEGVLYAYITDGKDGYTKCKWTNTPKPITYEKTIEIEEIGDVRTFEVSAEQKDSWTLSTGCTSLCTNIQCPLSSLWFVYEDYNIYHDGDCGYKACIKEGTITKTENKYNELNIYSGETQLYHYTNTITISYSADGFCGELSSSETCEPSGRTIYQFPSGGITYYYLTDGKCSYYRTANCPPSGAFNSAVPIRYIEVVVEGLSTQQVGNVQTFFGETLSGAADCVTYELTSCYENQYLGPASLTTSWYCSACEVYEAIECPEQDTLVDNSFKELSAVNNSLVVGYSQEFYTGGRIDNMTCEIVTISTCPSPGFQLGVIDGVVYIADGLCGYTVQCPESGTIVSLAFREAYTPLTPAINTEVGYSDLIYTGTEINNECIKIRKYNCLPKGTQIQESPDLDLNYNFFADGGNNDSQPCGYISCPSLSAKIVTGTVPEKVEIFCNRGTNSGGLQLSTVEVGYREVMYDGGYNILKSTCSTITGDCISWPANNILCVGVNTTIYTDGFCGVKECGNIGTRTTELVKTTIDDAENDLHGEITIGYIDKISQGPGSGRDCVSIYENFRCLTTGSSMGNLGGRTLYSNGGVPDNTLSGNCGYSLCPLSGTVIPYSYIMALEDYTINRYPLSAFGQDGTGCAGGTYTYIWGGVNSDGSCAIEQKFNFWPKQTFIYSDESYNYYATGSGTCEQCPTNGTELKREYNPASIIQVLVPELLGEGFNQPDGGFYVAYTEQIETADGSCGSQISQGSEYSRPVGDLFGTDSSSNYFYNGGLSNNGYTICPLEGGYISIGGQTEFAYMFTIYSDMGVFLTTIADGTFKLKSTGTYDTTNNSCSSVPEYSSIRQQGDLLYTSEEFPPVYYRYTRDPDNYNRGTYYRAVD
jgi:hypothetical protein